MANQLTLLLSTALITTFTLAAVPLNTQPDTKEFVYIQTHKSGARPIARKEKATVDDRPFETAHKLPLSLTFKLNQELNSDSDHKRHRREALPGAPAPAPVGSIKLDPLKLIQRYRDDLKVSSTVAPKAQPKTTKARSKKEVSYDHEPTSPRPVLTSGAPHTPRSLDINDAPLLASGSDKQRSKIQIKKGPNGQEYEYEYVYYYYDEENDKSSTTEKVFNSHDGPQRNLNKEKNYREASLNEVIPNGRGRSRGRQLELEESVDEERLPPSTRFPPRGRNIASTEVSEEDTLAVAAHNKERGRISYNSEESQGARSRTNGNVRRPALDLVDNASFNTHSNNGPSFPSDLPSGPVRFLGATPNERDESEESEGVNEQSNQDAITPSSLETTTSAVSPMDKVALDLYAVVQGTQKLSGEMDISESVGITSDEIDTTTILIETTEVSTEYTTPSTTTTTTTTTPAPTTTTTTTTEPPTSGRGRFRGAGSRKKQGTTTVAPASTETSHVDTKPKSRFNRPSFGRPKQGRTTTEATHESESNAEEHKSSSKSRPTTRSRFGSSRSKPTTEVSHSSEEEHVTIAKSSLNRSRPAFNSRSRGRSTTSASTNDNSSNDEETVSSTTARAKLKISGNNNVRPLRPGLKINSLSKGRATSSAPTTPASDTQPTEEVQEESKSSEESQEEPAQSPAPIEDKNPLNRLRNRHRPIPTISSAAKPKAAASTTVQVRRVNPLIGRRRPGVTEPSSTESSVEPESTDAVSAETNEGTESPIPSSSSTEEPKGLNKLLAGRRKLIQRHHSS